MAYHEEVDLSDKRKVFIASDIHGEFKMLEDALGDAGFEPKTDALVLAGDLIDRGPDSEAALMWITYPWVYRTLGNHCVAPGLVSQGKVAEWDASKWGGDWYLKYSKERIREIGAALDDAPITMTVRTPLGLKVGIAHADCGNDWDYHTSRVMDGRLDAHDMSLWSRETINTIGQKQTRGETVDPESVRVQNIDFVFHGHTPLGRPLTIANRSWIDTGAVFGGILTLIDIDSWVAYHTR